MAFSDAGTKAGHLSPWETCKAFALHTALQTIEATLQTRACDLLGERTNAWIGKHLRVKGGGCPTEGAVVKAIKRCQEEGWYPGKAESKSGGRPPVYTTRQKRKIAEAAMTLKRNIVRPTPAGVRAQVPRTCVHPESGEPVSDYTVYSIFKTMCHDDFEAQPVATGEAQRLRGAGPVRQACVASRVGRHAEEVPLVFAAAHRGARQSLVHGEQQGGDAEQEFRCRIA